jgi:5-methylcytosine-specific restriction enzyme subunit McrC
LNVFSLKEYETAYFAHDLIPTAVGERLYRNYGAQVHVAFPSPKTEHRWALTSLGWVGTIPLAEGLSLVLQPKVPLHNLFGMLDYAYRLRSFHVLEEDLIHSSSLEAFYENLACVLARRVLDRARKGLHRAYVDRAGPLPYVAGRMNVRCLMRRPWDPHLRCHVEAHTADIADNQILAWTLRHILRSGVCTARTLPVIRQAYRALRGSTTLHPYTAQDCAGRLYHRLNADYHPMHALCRFFLEHAGPGHSIGDRTFLPFLVNMARLYELFVAEWLKRHLDTTRFQLKAQDTVTLGARPDGAPLRFNIDLTLYDAKTQRAVCVLDTKYKTPAAPSSEDLAQVVMYAELKHCRDAYLIYPVPVPFAQQVGRIRVRSLTFAIGGGAEHTSYPLEESGRAFLEELYRCFVADDPQVCGDISDRSFNH